jgi:hypothetical protein
MNEDKDKLAAAAPEMLAALVKIAAFHKFPANQGMSASDLVAAMSEIARDAYTKAINQ